MFWVFEAEADAQHADHRKAAWHTWHGAALQRQAKLPKLDKFMSVTSKPKPRQTWEQQKKIMDAWAKRLNRKDKA